MYFCCIENFLLINYIVLAEWQSIPYWNPKPTKPTQKIYKRFRKSINQWSMTNKQNSCRVNRSSEKRQEWSFPMPHWIPNGHFFQIDVDIRAVDLFSDSVSPHRTSMEEGLGTNTIEFDSALVTLPIYFGFWSREYSPSFISFLFLIYTCYFNNKTWRYMLKTND